MKLYITREQSMRTISNTVFPG
uniref:Uncharacterized protein n=1 Tax=Anguilla anguilla TaxID=7936 RepID=A0A0E9S775_ANGAN